MAKVTMREYVRLGRDVRQALDAWLESHGYGTDAYVVEAETRDDGSTRLRRVDVDASRAGDGLVYFETVAHLGPMPAVVSARLAELAERMEAP